jgi:UDP-N-acetylglucosamine pyrophosphorylase
MNQAQALQTTPEKILNLSTLSSQLKKTKKLEQKKELLLEFIDPSALETYRTQFEEIKGGVWEEITFYALIAIDQAKIILQEPSAAKKMIEALAPIERFYENLGGLVGYYFTALQLIASKTSKRKVKYLKPPVFDVTHLTQSVKKSVSEAIAFLPQLAELYPIGGLGDRLNLRGEHDEPLPTAVLPFCGRTLLEGLVRDVQAREYLYYKLYDDEVITPLALMTSHEKENDRHIREICEGQAWFNRPKDSFFLFSQLSVPVITSEGNFSMRSNHELNLHPGGHGAIWRTAEEIGVFKWLQKQKKEGILIRQINNPIAGLDYGLLALIGHGLLQNKTFGFASCKRVPNAAEGVLVLRENENKEFAIVNIEYTDFKKFGIEDTTDEEGYSLFPTNTNILFARLAKILPFIRQNPLPGLIINMKSDVPSFDENGNKKNVKGGRLESMMQNISEGLTAHENELLPTYVTNNERLKTISTTKKAHENGKSLLETPSGAFYDLMLNASELLKWCGVDIPEMCRSEEYLKSGPTILFLYHPALGPLYEVIRQKIRGGRWKKGAEMQLEIAEVLIESLDLEGSLLIEAKDVMGHVENKLLHYSYHSGKCVLKDVKVRNQGMNRDNKNLYWKNAHGRKEAFTLILEGSGEFYAENVTIEGNLEIRVPDGFRFTLFQNVNGTLSIEKEKIESPTWHWEYRLIKDEIHLFQTAGA